MIEEKVLDLAQTLVNNLEAALADFPKYSIDGTWPSIGILDLLAAPLFGNKDFSPTELSLIDSIAAYIAGFAHDCWTRYPNAPEVTLSYHADGRPRGVVIEAKRGAFLKRGERFAVPVSEVLQSIFAKPPRPFPIIAQFSRDLASSGNFVSRFALGLVSGLCPFGDGPWKNLSLTEFKPQLLIFEEFITKTASDYYTRAFPGETIGQHRSLYEANVLLPPAGMDESAPYARAATGLAAFLMAIDASYDEMKNVAINLAYNPDEQIATTGFIAATALLNGDPPKELRALSERFGNFRVELKPAIIIARQIFGHPADWVKQLDERKPDEAIKILRIEKALGLCPFMRIDPGYARYPQLIPLLHNLYWSQPKEAREYIDFIGKLQELPIDLRLQAILLDILGSNLNRTEAELLQIEKQYEFRSSNSRAWFFELKGMYFLRTGAADKALQAFQSGFKLKPSDSDIFTSLGNNLGWCYLLIQDFENALDVFSQVIYADDVNIAARLNRLAALDGLGKQGESQDEVRNLARISPMDQRIFDQLLRRVLRTLH